MTQRGGDDGGDNGLLIGDREAFGPRADYDYEGGYRRRYDRAAYLPDFLSLAGERDSPAATWASKC